MQITVTPPKIICAIRHLSHIPFARLVFFLAKAKPANANHPIWIGYAIHLVSVHGKHDGNISAHLTHEAVKNPRLFLVELGVEM